MPVLYHDRPGKLQVLSAAVKNSGCSQDENRMSVAGAYFSKLAMVFGNWGMLAKLEDLLSVLE